MSRRNWKRARATSLIEALRMCKEFAQERHSLSVERIADRMGVTHDSLYKWLATGRMPAILLPTYEHACGCQFASIWLASSTGKLVIDRPTGKVASQADMVEFNSGFARALQLLSDFHENPSEADTTTTLAALSAHLEQVAFHHRSVATYATPELEF
jgi:hypothetical protein